MNAIEIHDLTKRYKDFTLDHLNLVLPSGTIMGLVGENGAGKSTTIKLILDMIEKDEGTVYLFGKNNKEDIKELKKEIGVVLDEVGIPDCLNTDEVSKLMSLTFGNWDNDEYYRLLNKFNIPNKEYKDLSRGNKMKLGIAVAMSHNAKLLILDEATSGLDPIVRDEVVSMLNEFTRIEDHSILISSHIVSDLEKLCDYIAFIHNGKLMLCEEKDKLLSSYGVLYISEEELEKINREAILYICKNEYGVKAIVKRYLIDRKDVSPIGIEELFVLMVKEAR